MSVNRPRVPQLSPKSSRYRRLRPSHSSAFRRFRAAAAGQHWGAPPVKNGPYGKDGTSLGGDASAGQLLRLSKAAVLAILLTVLLAMTLLRGWQAVERSGIFQLRQINVQGCRIVREEELLALAELRLGVPLFGIDLPEAEQRVRRHPWIDTVSIRRSWPDTLHVLVQERRPLALINLEKGLHYVDQHGAVFAPVKPGQDIDFPVLTGLDLLPGASLAEGPAEEAVQLLQLAAQGNPILPLQALSEIHLSRDGEIIAYLAERPFPIHLGYGRIRPRYYQLVRLLERLYRKEKIEDIREIRMDYQPGRILVAKLEP
ncbi:MAG: cell division protein FtsQ/DivIB [Candidatus Electronema sp. V4]|uniref:cell division protein FtsQ/DivIB n=1 Tax=Candidatus Electronema sp. V4 TaxID=3454756 RepID=UPI0040558F03